MSRESHPNINAAGFTADIVKSFYKYLRGRANQDGSTKADAGEILQEEILDFVTKISERLDSEFGRE